MYLCVLLLMCPCIDGVRGDNSDKSESSMGNGAEYSVGVMCVCGCVIQLCIIHAEL